VAKAIRELKHNKGRHSDNSKSENNLLLFQGRIYVPKDLDLRLRIIKQHHDSLIAGHPGRWKTLELVSQSYWWPQMSRYIGLYTKSCDLCCQTKMQRQKPTGELHPSATPAKCWSIISVDFVLVLPLVKSNHNAIMNIVDIASKQAHFILTYNTVTAEDFARLFLRHI
jgi:hypothetical protein